jgi:ligand-binding sensor domain-containing protein
MNMIPLILTLSVEIAQWTHHPHFGAVNHMITDGELVIAATAGGILFCTASGEGVSFDSTWTYGDQLKWDRVSSLYRHEDGSLWVTYLGAGIEVFHPDGSVTSYGQLQGLPLNLMINQVHPDTVLYAATTQGLSINSVGYFITYNESGTGGGLPSSVVNCLAPSDSGLLVGTYSGLALLLPGQPPSEASSWREVALLSGSTVNGITARSDTLWVIAGNKVYLCPPGGQWALQPSYPGTRATSLLNSSAGILVGSQDAVYTWSAGAWTEVEGEFMGGLVTALGEVNGGGIVAGMMNTISEERLEGPGLALMRDGAVTRHVPPGCISNDIMSIGVNSAGVCWVGAHRSGVGYYNDSQWRTVYGAMPSFNQIFAVGVRENTVFAASWHSGVTWLDWDGQYVQGGITFTTDDGLPNDQINAISVWDDGTVWFAHEPYWQYSGEPSGISRLSWQPGIPETASISVISSAGSLLGKEVKGVAAVSATRAWAATTDGLALVSVDGGVEQAFTTANGLPSNNVMSVAVTRNGDVYAGTATGLARVRDGVVRMVNGVTGSVGSLCPDHRGGVWAAVPGALYRIGSDDDLLVFTTYNTPLPEVDIRDMSCDWESGQLWLATSHGVWVADIGQGLGGDSSSAVLYPNPFRPGAGEVLGIAGVPDEPMAASIFDLSGGLLYRCSTTGRGDFAWDGSSTDGSPVPSGVYILILERQGVSELLKFALVR